MKQAYEDLLETLGDHQCNLSCALEDGLIRDAWEQVGKLEKAASRLKGKLWDELDSKREVWP